MQKKGIKFGLPHIAHGGMWGDMVLTPVATLIVAWYMPQWSLWSIDVCAAIGFLASSLMHWLYTKGKTPESHVMDGSLTIPGIFHWAYFGIVVTIFLLFYFATPHVSVPFMWFTTVLLTVHTAVGNHFVLGLIKPSWYPDKPLESPIGWATVIGTWVVLAMTTSLRFG